VNNFRNKVVGWLFASLVGISFLLFLIGGEFIGAFLLYLVGILLCKVYVFKDSKIICSRPFLLGFWKYPIDYQNVKSVQFSKDSFAYDSMRIYTKNENKEYLRFIYYVRPSVVNQIHEIIRKKTGKDLVIKDW